MGQPSTRDTRRAMVLKNYASLRTNLQRMDDPWSADDSGTIGNVQHPTMGVGRWADRLEYMCDVNTPSDVATTTAHLAALAAVDAAEAKLSDICVRFINATDPAKVDNRAARQYLFDAFGACERAWARMASAGMVRGRATGMGMGYPQRTPSNSMGQGGRTRNEPMGGSTARVLDVQGKMGF